MAGSLSEYMGGAGRVFDLVADENGQPLNGITLTLVRTHVVAMRNGIGELGERDVLAIVVEHLRRRKVVPRRRRQWSDGRIRIDEALHDDAQAHVRCLRCLQIERLGEPSQPAAAAHVRTT